MICRQVKKLSKINSNMARSMSMWPTDEMVPMPQRLQTRDPKSAVITQTTLPNGARLVSRHSDSSIASLKFVIAAGSQAENAGEKGAAHFLSAAAYSGSQHKSGLALVRSLENIGCVINSTADREKIVFDCKTRVENADEATALMLEAIFTTSDNEFEMKERIYTVAGAQYELARGCYKNAIRELLYEAAYGEGTALGSSLYASSLENINLNNVKAYKKRNFLGSNLIFAANGISHAAMTQSLKQFATPSGASFALTSKPSPFVGGMIKSKQDLHGSTVAALAFPTPSGNREKAAFAVVSRMLSSKLSSDKSVDVFMTSHFLGFSVRNATSKVASSLQTVVDALKAVSSASAASTIKQLSLEMFTTLEGINSVDVLVASTLQSDGRIVDHASLYAVTDADVKAAVQSMLKTASPAYSVMGETVGAPSYDQVRNLLK